MKTHRAVASLLTLLVATATTTASAGGQPQPSHDPNQYSNRGEPEWAKSFAGIRVNTDPVLDAQMGFSFPTEVREILVKGAQRVTQGDLLIRAKDAEAVAAEKIQKKRSELRLPIDSAEVTLTLRQLELDGAERAFQDGAASPLERDQAKAQRDKAQIELELAKENFAEQALLLERTRGELDRFRIYAPFDGLIESVSVDPGQAVSETQPVLRIVNIDRLKSRVPTPSRQVMEMQLKAGDPAWIVMDLPGDPKVFLGRVSEVSPVGDFATQKTNVRVEFDNPDAHPAGLTAWVRFSEPTGEWTQRIVVNENDPDGVDPSRRSEETLVVGAANTAGVQR